MYNSSLNEFAKPPDSERYKQRLIILMACMLVALTVLFLRLIHLQILEGEDFRRLSENNAIRLQIISAPRGQIFDSHDRLLVDNRPSFDLNIVLKDAQPLEHTIHKLARLLEVPAETLTAGIDGSRRTHSLRPVLLKQDIGWDMLATVEVNRHNLPGIVVDVKPRRHYLNNPSGAHLLGYLGEINAREMSLPQFTGYRRGDLIGRFGVEKTYESYLRGINGGQQVEVNATGHVIRVLQRVDAQPGHNVFLTIDASLQELADNLLDGRAGAALAMEPSTGRMLAMVSSPAFDQNAFAAGLSHAQWQNLVGDPLRPLENKAIQGEYPPASVYKIIAALAALEEGVVDTRTTYFCPGFMNYGGRDFRCWRRTGHGTMDLNKALAESCDVYFYQLGLKLGVDRLAWYAKAAGMGVATEIELDNESRGLVPSVGWKNRRMGKPWYAGETLSVAIGQGYNLATPLQMLVLTAAVANGGTRFQPLLIDRIESAQGDTVYTSQPQVTGKLPVSPQHLQTVQKGLWEVVNGPRGTARVARLNETIVAGKTGTAQVFSRRRGDAETDEQRAMHLRSHAWFVAYAPFDDPRIAVAVIIEHGERGSSAAGPIARDMIQHHLRTLAPEGESTSD